MFNNLNKYVKINPLVNTYLTVSKSWLPVAIEAQHKEFNLKLNEKPIPKNLQNELKRVKLSHNKLVKMRTEMLNMLGKNATINALKNNGGRSVKQNASSVLNDLRNIRKGTSKEAVRAAVNRIIKNGGLVNRLKNNKGVGTTTFKRIRNQETNNSKNNMARRAAFMFLQRPNAENIVKKLMA
tara:strand:+ start:176 stop:721 length:546 start_codon:yes stop_codon:yes gene_type:complete